MFSNLLLYRFIIFNSLAVAVAIALWWSGYLLPVFDNDQSRLTVAIAALFLVGWVGSWRKAATVSLKLNDSKLKGPQPACAAQSDKDVAKTEWLTSISEWLVALGLLGTVVGFSMALAGVDQGAVSTANGAQSAVTALMQGMRIALNTTLLGAALALWHEINVRMLKTALAVYWADRITVWQQMRKALPAGPVRSTTIWNGSDVGLPIPTNSMTVRRPFSRGAMTDQREMKP